MGSRNPDAPETPRTRSKKIPLSVSCKVQVGRGPLRRGTAALAEEELRFHTGRTGREGEDFAVHVRHEDIVRVEADGPGGTLTVETREQGTLVFHLGRLAVGWKELLDERPDLLRDLGVGPCARIALVGVQDEALEAALGPRAGDPGGEVDVLFVGAEHRNDLARLPALAARVGARGVVWVVYPDGARGLSEKEVAAAARAAGLVDGTTVELSPGRLALRLSRSGS